MSRCASAVLGFVAAGSVGCGSAVDAEPTDSGGSDLVSTVCNGSEELQLLIVVAAPWDRVGFDQRLLYENGAASILIDGQCRFWVDPAEGAWTPARTGALEPAQMASLLTDLRYARWGELEGLHPAAPGTFDVADLVFMDGTSQVVCAGGCAADVVPADVLAMRDAATAWNGILWESGAAIVGDMRMQVFVSGLTGEPADLIQATAWPITSVDLGAVAIPYEESESTTFGQGILIRGTEAEELRRLRREYMAEEHGSWWYQFIPIRDETGTLHQLYVRDTTPFENDVGLIGWLFER